MILPDCMMPDGADPCRGYHELYAETATLRQRIAELEDPHYLKGLQAEIEQLKAELQDALGVCDTYTKHIEFLRGEAADRTKKVECLWALCDARKDEIERLRAEIAALQNENKQLQYGDASEQWSRGWVRTDFIHEIESLRADAVALKDKP